MNSNLQFEKLSGQMHGLVLLDKSGNPLRSPIIWSDDQRTPKELKQGYRKYFQRIV